MRRWPFRVPLLFLLTAVLSVPAFADKRVALVIGNSAYRNVGRLDNPANDAKLLSDTLRALGFTLVGGGAQLDLDKPAFDRTVQAFGAQLAGADVGLFYYAGHGVQVRGENYLIPVDANPTKEADVDFQMLDTNLVLRQMEGAGTRLNIVILDACRNNPFGGRSLAVGRARDAESDRMRDTGGGLAQMQAPEGTLISFATQPGSVAQDGADGNSPYAKALALTMRRPNLDIFQTFNQVGLAVKRATKGAQQPWVSSSPIDGSFYFVAPPAADTPGPAPMATLSAPLPAPSADRQSKAASPPQPVLINEADIRRLAERQKIRLPPALAVNAPGPSVPAGLADYLGTWGGDQQWGNGRNVILIIADIDKSGNATGIFAQGPPNANSPEQGGAFYKGFKGRVTGDGVTFLQGDFTFTFKLFPGKLLWGHAQGRGARQGVESTIMLQRNPRIEQQAMTGPVGPQNIFTSIDQQSATPSMDQQSKTTMPVAASSVAPSAPLPPQDQTRVGSLTPHSATSDVVRFDGFWETTIVCESAGEVLGWSRKFIGRVKNGIFHGQFGVEGKPGFDSYDGMIEPDGSIEFVSKGLTSGDSKRTLYHAPPGIMSSWRAAGRFEATRGSAIRVEGRTCNINFAKQ
jgi:Caspase domain